MSAAEQRTPHELPRIPLYRFAGPRYWGVWLGIAIVRLVNVLPLPMQLAIGRGLGRLAYVFSRRDRRIARVNIDMCLPDLAPAERKKILEDHFASLGCALFETGLVWWASDARLKRLIRFEGLEHLQAALAKGKGALMLSAHFTTLEMGARALTLVGPTSVMYLTPSNDLIAELSRRGRSRHTIQAVTSAQIRELLQNLKNNLPVWYAPDQRFTEKSGELVPFFGIPSASNVATSRLARISGAPVLPYFPQRRADNRGYVVRIHPPFENFPSDDAVADTRRFHELIEANVRRHPDQYLWAYKRFRREGFDPYRRTEPNRPAARTWPLWHPRYWPTWLALGTLRAFEPLPFPVLLALGRILGALLVNLPLGFVRIARRNLELCFPEKPAVERKAILRTHFHSVAIGLFETAMSWWSSDERIRKLSTLEGREHLDAALAKGKGAILLSAHFTTLEIGARALTARGPTNIMYRPTRNLVLERFLAKNRSKHAKCAIPRDDIRTLISALKANEPVWYAPDQAYRKKGAQMVPFFGIAAATNTATSRLARMTGATVLPYFVERLPGSRGYRMTIMPALDDFPSDDAAADARRFNDLIEAHVRKVPGQYLWIHRRFKGLTAEYPDYYN
jgi:KDO2-lipid IV(A) lauroyltransferase